MTVRILLLEDNDADAELVEVELRRAELDFTARRVVTRPDFERALQRAYSRARPGEAQDTSPGVDAEVAVGRASPSVLPLLGCGAEELGGHHIGDLVHPDDIGRAVRVFAEGVGTGRGDRLLGLQ